MPHYQSQQWKGCGSAAFFKGFLGMIMTHSTDWFIMISCPISNLFSLIRL
jgi:hypothetical protein